jgi:hypothetical protein
MPRLTGAATDYFTAKVRINYTQGGGWTEKYQFNTVNRQTAQNLLTDLCIWRNYILAGNCTITFASASQQSVLRDSIIPFKLPTSPFLLAQSGVWGNGIETTAETCNNPQSGLYVRFSSSAGVWSNHLFRGIRDSWQSDDFNVVSGVNLPGSITTVNPAFVSSYPVANANAPVPGFPAQAAVQAFCQWIANNTVFVQPGASTAGNPQPGLVASYSVFGGGRLRTHQVGYGYNQRKARRKRGLPAMR